MIFLSGMKVLRKSMKIMLYIILYHIPMHVNDQRCEIIPRMGENNLYATSRHFLKDLLGFFCWRLSILHALSVGLLHMVIKRPGSCDESKQETKLRRSIRLRLDWIDAVNHFSEVTLLLYESCKFQTIPELGRSQGTKNPQHSPWLSYISNSPTPSGAGKSPTGISHSNSAAPGWPRHVMSLNHCCSQYASYVWGKTWYNREVNWPSSPLK
jgi:hypothetical protein